MRRRLPPVEEAAADERGEEDRWLEAQVRWARAAATPLPWLVPAASAGADVVEQWAVVVEAYEAHEVPLPMAVPTGQAASHRALPRSVEARLAAVGLLAPRPYDPRTLLEHL